MSSLNNLTAAIIIAVSISIPSSAFAVVNSVPSMQIPFTFVGGLIIKKKHKAQKKAAKKAIKKGVPLSGAAIRHVTRNGSKKSSVRRGGSSSSINRNISRY